VEHPDLYLLIQKSMHEERIQRATAIRQRPASQRVSRLRVITGTTLMTIGARIAATPRAVNPGHTLAKMSVPQSAENA